MDKLLFISSCLIISLVSSQITEDRTNQDSFSMFKTKLEKGEPIDLSEFDRKLVYSTLSRFINGCTSKKGITFESTDANDYDYYNDSQANAKNQTKSFYMTENIDLQFPNMFEVNSSQFKSKLFLVDLSRN